LVNIKKNIIQKYKKLLTFSTGLSTAAKASYENEQNGISINWHTSLQLTINKFKNMEKVYINQL